MSAVSGEEDDGFLLNNSRGRIHWAPLSAAKNNRLNNMTFGAGVPSLCFSMGGVSKMVALAFFTAAFHLC